MALQGSRRTRAREKRPDEVGLREESKNRTRVHTGKANIPDGGMEGGPCDQKGVTHEMGDAILTSATGKYCMAKTFKNGERRSLPAKGRE